MIMMIKIMNLMNFLFISMVFLIFITIYHPNSYFLVNGDFQKCSPAYCRTVKCDDRPCKGSNQILFHNVTKCGCCSLCIEQLDEGSDCQFEMNGNIPHTQCAAHLKCVKDPKLSNKATCQKISDVTNNGCEYERKKIEENPFQMIAGQQPECDQYGQYSLKQCKNGTLCQCIKTYKDGKTGLIKTRPIFGTDIYTNSEKMNCLCSYQFENTNEKLREITRTLKQNQQWQMMNEYNKWNYDRDIDPIFYLRCKPNGNYESYQIYGKYAYCIDEKTGQVEERPVALEQSKSLPCYSKRYTLRTDCLKEYNKTVEKYYKLKDEGFNNIVAFDLPNCDLDGTYAPVQCENDKCYCVNKKGERYQKSKFNRDDQYFGDSQQCTCLRYQDLIRDIKKRDKITELFSKYQCDINGNYLPLQCSNTQCYCVDPITGLVTDDMDPPLKTELEAIHALHCYKSYPDNEKYRLDELLFDSTSIGSKKFF